MLNKRLEAVASFVLNNSSCLDVGCDHGLLDIYLYKNKKNIKIVASDINEKPLEMARENFKKYKVDIPLRLGDGLDIIDYDTDTVIISGMGGLSICNILKKDKLTNVKYLVLSPNRDFYEVRKKVVSLGYLIGKEKFVKENGKYYLVLYCIKGMSKYSNTDLKYGVNVIKDNDYYSYLGYLLVKYNNQLDKVPRKYWLKRFKIKKEIIKIKSFL